jgi:site-specific recombinase XerD
VQHFLKFVRFDHNKTAIQSLTLAKVHRYLRSVSSRYQRKTMQHVVGSVRGFLRFQFMRGVIRQPLHDQIDTLRTYQDEHLPYPVQWRELQQVLQRIDRTTLLGLRDYAVLLLAVSYGMGASDVWGSLGSDLDI